MKLIIIVLLTTFSYFLCMTNAARILGIFPLGAKSHFNYNYAILKHLHDAGHQITMITPFPPEKKLENFTFIDSRHNGPVYVGRSTINDFTDMTVSQTGDWITSMGMQFCYNVMRLPQIQKVIKSQEKLYDLMLVELHVEYSCYLPIAERLQIPVIGTMTVRFWQFTDHAVGAPHNPAVLPALIDARPSEMNYLIDRIKNLWVYLVMEYYYTKISKEIDKFHRENFPKDLLHKKDISLVFYNSHATIISRPVPAKVIEIAGIHMQSETQPLSKELQQFIDEATRGVILFTFGSVVRASSMTLTQREAFIAAFSTVPQRVIWKFEEPIKNLPKNVMIVDWLPQKDILQHKNVIVFMSHCGQSGMYEAIATGTPVVTIPLFLDQRVNAATLQHFGVGVDLELETVTNETVLTALNTIINDTSYYRRSQELSRLFKDRPLAPGKSVLFWTDYVLRHNGAPYFKALGSDMPFYKYFMLDILALAFLTMSSIVMMIFWILKKIFFVPVANSEEVSTKKGN